MAKQGSDTIAVFLKIGGGLSDPHVSPITRHVTRYQQDWAHGPLYARFRLQTGEGDIDGDLIRYVFDNHFMKEIVVIANGSECFRGYITDMTLDMDGSIRKKSTKNLANAIKVKVSAGSGEDDTYTDWMVDGESALVYGRFEKLVTFKGTPGSIIDLDRYNSDGTENDNYLKPVKKPDGDVVTEVDKLLEAELTNSSPYRTGIIASANEVEPFLDIELSGRAALADNILLSDGYFPSEWQSEGRIRLRWTMNSKWTNVIWGTETIVSDEIYRIIDVVERWGHWLYWIDSPEKNSVVTYHGVMSPTGAMNRLYQLLLLPNEDNEYYEFTIGLDGGCFYQKRDYEPKFEFYRGSGLVDLSTGDKPRYMARPGIIRYPDEVVAMPQNSLLIDNEFGLIERVTMYQDEDSASLMPYKLTDLDIANAQIANRHWLESERERKK